MSCCDSLNFPRKKEKEILFLNFVVVDYTKRLFLSFSHIAIVSRNGKMENKTHNFEYICFAHDLYVYFFLSSPLFMLSFVSLLLSTVWVTGAFTFNKKFMNLVFQGKNVVVITIFLFHTLQKLNGMLKLAATYFSSLIDYFTNLLDLFWFEYNVGSWKIKLNKLLNSFYWNPLIVLHTYKVIIHSLSNKWNSHQIKNVEANKKVAIIDPSNDVLWLIKILYLSLFCFTVESILFTCRSFFASS